MASQNSIIATAPGSDSKNKINIGNILLESKVITAEDAERVINHQQTRDIRFGEAALQLGLATEADVQYALARQFDYPYVRTESEQYAPELIAAYQPFSVETESLRNLRSQLMLRWFALGRKSITLLSLDSEKQTSLLVANLGVLFSQLGTSTIIVDANLRRPNQHAIFKLEGRTGLSDVLAGRAGVEVISRVEPFSFLSILPAGTHVPNPQELINQPTFIELDKFLNSQFNVVLYSAPALTNEADALTIASLSKAILFVGNKDNTRSKDVKSFSTQLESIGVNIIGSVLMNC